LSAGGKIIRWAVRILFLVLALLLSLGGPIPGVLARFLPAMSPLVGLASSLSQRRWYLGFFWAVPPLLMLLVAFWKGRFFCRWACPAGTLYSLPARWSRKKVLLTRRLNAYFFWTIVFASLVGAPLLLFLDPLSTFNRITPLLTGTYTIASLVPGLLLPLFLVLGFFQPMIWCAYLCPLGYLFELCPSVRRQGPAATFSRSRRQIVAGLLIGAPLAALTRRFLLAKPGCEQPPILPPGARDMETFASACTRCYACVDVCPTGIIQVRFSADRALGQFFQPEIRYFDREDAPDLGYCPEPCNECSRVCPAGALSPLTFDQKWRRQIGVAKVIREACLAWEDGEECMVCVEYCPYQAIEMETSKAGVLQPVVIEDLCRGCGTCQSKCPAIRAGKAIIVSGVREQKQLKDEDADAGFGAPSPS